MSTISVNVIRIPTKGPGDVSGLMQLIAEGEIAPSTVLAVLGKTEGNGGVNDFTREYAVAALCDALSPHLDLPPRAVEDRIAFVMSGGTEGVLSPHLTVFTRRETSPPTNGAPNVKRLSIGIAHTRDFLPEEIGRKVQIDETVNAVHRAMKDAGIDDPHDVHFVQIKCPLLTSERIEAAAYRGHKTVTTGAYASMAYSRGVLAWRGTGVRRDSGCSRGSGAEGLAAVFVGCLLVRRYRTDAQCRDRHGKFVPFGESFYDRSRRHAGFDRSFSCDESAPERRP